MAFTNLRKYVRRGRNFEPTWRYLFNCAPTFAYRVKRPVLTGEVARVLANLNRDGMAITTTQSLFGADPCFDELCESFYRLQHESSEQLEQARAETSYPDKVGEKSFIFEYLGSRPLLEPSQIYARFALQEHILQIANAYLGMYTRLRYYNIWHTFTTKEEARQSQLWHRDREDRYILKVFVYLSDVGDNAGPFTYAAGSHAKGQVKNKPDCFFEGGVERSTDAQMAKVVPSEQWIKGIGPKGTIIFADTHGYHKGGLARETDRIMYTCMFTSPASESREFWAYPEKVYQPANRAQAFALAPPKRGAWLSWNPKVRLITANP